MKNEPREQEAINMSIDRRTRYSWFCVCDCCGTEISGGTCFQDSVAARKKEGWRSIKDDAGEWMDLCPDCQKAMKEAEYHGKKQ